MNPSSLFKKSTSVRFSLPPSLLTGPLTVAPWLQEPVLGRLFFSPGSRTHRTSGQSGCPVAKIQVAGKCVTVRARGSGPAVLLVHGWQGSSGDLRRWGDSLVRAGFTAVTCDMPAHGESEGATTSVAEFRDAIEQIAEIAGPLHGIVAHSLGGTAATLALNRHLSVRGIVLVAPMPSFDVALDEFARLFSLNEKLREATARAAEKRVGLTRADVDLVTLDLPHIPALIIHDEKDRRSPIAYSRALAEKWPEASLFSTNGFGHMRVVDADQVIEKGVRFLCQVPRISLEPLELGLVPEVTDVDFMRSFLST